MSKARSENTLLIVLILLFITCVLVATYLLLSKMQQRVKLDRYAELQNICTSEKFDENYIMTCPGLLLDISTTKEQISCFEIQIITKDNILKTTSICELNEKFQYSNDILNYKKLLPIEISFSYISTTVENSYQLDKISLALLDSASIASIINIDIQGLTESNPSNSTIKNSVDFCPAPEALPNFVTEENKQRYSEYYNRNILSQDQYRELYSQEFRVKFLENWSDPTIKILFGCESSSRMGYNSICYTQLPDKYKHLTITNIPNFSGDWDIKEYNDTNKITLKNISLVYDGILYQEEHSNYASDHIVDELFQFINDSDNNQNIYCHGFKLLNILKGNQEIQNSLDSAPTLLDQNIKNLSSICTNTLDDQIYNNVGIYLKAFYTIEKDTTFTIYEKCNNLYLLFNEQPDLFEENN